MIMIDQHQITGLLLAGGIGTRMGRVDKGLQVFRNIPLARHVLMRLAPQVGAIIINANQNIDQYQAFSYPVLSDQMAGFAGPLAGLQTGLQHCQTPYLLSVPCDSPLLPWNLVARLSEGLMVNDADLAVAVTLESENGVSYRQRHPVFALMKLSVLPGLNDFLNGGGRKVDAWFQQLAVAEVLFEDHSGFANINTLQELKQLES
ncbi:molybdenum cofactor guanylyltransferase MobA [Undibacterium sp. Dicai25W]|uniref:molybdenum cofactor guanylyltransferase MobA n=1 Tax=Undibacterium sp. Dicai25W TaxID=3413034 RepID=UPI003BEF941A